VDEGPSKVVLRRLFEKYGEKDRMTFEGFEHLLESLGLGRVAITDHDVSDHRTLDGKFRQFHANHRHSGAPPPVAAEPPAIGDRTGSASGSSGTMSSGRRRRRDALVESSDVSGTVRTDASVGVEDASSNNDTTDVPLSSVSY
jgi:hypothetical protein